MLVTVKLFASLASHLPRGPRPNEAQISVDEASTVGGILDRLGVPVEQRHLVLLDGVYVAPEQRSITPVVSGQVIAVWPMVAGG